MEPKPKRLNAEAYLGEIQRIFDDPNITAEQAAALKTQVSGGEPWSNAETVVYFDGLENLDEARQAYLSAPSDSPAAGGWSIPTARNTPGVLVALTRRALSSGRARPVEETAIDHLDE